MSDKNMLSFQQYCSLSNVSETSADDCVGEQWCFEHGISSERSDPWILRAEGKQGGGRREAKKNLIKVRNEWAKVKEEMLYVNLRGEHLNKAIRETDRRVEKMLEELERANECLRELIAKND